jgi:hypothetical protein
VHFKDKDRPQLTGTSDDSSENELNKVKIPEKNPLCLGSYLVTPPKGTQVQTMAGGYYQIKDTHAQVEALLSLRQETNPGVIDSYQVLKPACKSHLEVLKGQPAPTGNTDWEVRYTRSVDPPPELDSVCRQAPRRSAGVLATRRLAAGSAITFDVFMRSDKALSPHGWQQVKEYLRSLEQQTLSTCDQPGRGNDPGGPRLVARRSPPSSHANSPLRINVEDPLRCVI